MYSQKSNSENVVNFIKRRKADLRSIFHSKCCLCGFSEVQEALDFHHVNPKEKSFGISGSANQTKALEPQLEELKKCILVCANCHRGIHQGIYTIPQNWKDFYDEEVAQQLRIKLEKVKTHQIIYCKRCGKEISKGAQYCPSCWNILSRVCERPSREILKQLIRTTPFTHIAQHYGVTDNAIRKWCDAYSLPRKATEIKKFSDEEWKKIQSFLYKKTIIIWVCNSTVEYHPFKMRVEGAVPSKPTTSVTVFVIFCLTQTS